MMFLQDLNTWLMFWCFGVYYILSVDAAGLYFPMGNVALKIPASAKFDHASFNPIVVFNAFPVDISENEYGNITFSFTGSDLVQITPDNGTLTFSLEFYEQMQHNGLVDIAGIVTASDMSAPNSAGYIRTGETEIQIRAVVPTQPADCDLFSKELCFWNTVTYQLYENRPPTEIGTFGSPYLMNLCPLHELNYTLINGTDQLKIDLSSFSDNYWSLYSKKYLDRDIVRGVTPDNHKISGDGSVLYFTVKCTVSSPSGTIRDLEQSFRLKILDENDNAPKYQHSHRSFNVEISENDTDATVQAKMDNIIFIDRDSMEVNNYTVKLLQDDLRLFKVKESTWVDDRNGEHQMAIHIRIEPAKNIKTKIPKPSYTIVLQINDTKLLPGYGDSSANLTIHFSIKNTTKNATDPSNLRRNILYPPQTEIFRTAAPLARVSQANADLADIAKNFILVKDSSAKGLVGAFNVTVRQGIIYVQNISYLSIAANPVQLEIQWMNKTTNKTQSDQLRVDLVMDTKPGCPTNITNTFKHWSFCAKIRSRKDCTETCGLGTGGSASIATTQHRGHKMCVWRSVTNPSNHVLTSYYSTCTPDLETCPDFKCDALEELHPMLCPQDCTTSIKWQGELNNETGRGIKQGRGICTCDHLGCYCGQKTSSSKKGSSKANIIVSTTVPPMTAENNLLNSVSTNISRQIAVGSSVNDMVSCGTPCILGIAGGTIFLLAALVAIAVCWRVTPRIKATRRDRKFTRSESIQLDPDNNRNSQFFSSHNGLLLNFDMAGVQYVIPKFDAKAEAKWMFPRNRLHIEQTLGEGEFGRVLRAKALDIAGIPGYTTVAVKTLKDGARYEELSDLLSEYQLLKEVSHPNVIRLLGASFLLTDGSFYLIIEFAVHGSLRNYLRRSRHLESEGRTPNSSSVLMPGEGEQTSTTTEPTFKISPRDILSFAWQIAKGMTYLHDMKLVHRDLAARNVLLAEGMVCKISDFGLTRDVYEDDTYLKKTRGRVPVKWMALESLADHVYNSKSDVWSFGILLWELVTLGTSPYPGVAVQSLFHLLKSGYRMEKPDNCSLILYEIMRSCWRAEPLERPTFRTLTLRFESMLADGIDYLDLNPHVVHNRTYFTNIADAEALLMSNGINISESVDMASGYGNITLRQPDTVNLLSHLQSETKCAEADKLQVLWKRPKSPKTVNINTRTYENEVKLQPLQDYESPIKLRNKDKALKTPSNERPQSYLDMAGAGTSECLTLIRPCSKEGYETVTKITSL